MRLGLAVWGLGAAIVAAFVLLNQYEPDSAAAGVWFDRFAIVPARFDAVLAGAYGSPFEAAPALFGHVFFHYGFLHLLMNGLAYLQAAPFVGARLGDVRFLLLFFISAVGGAAAYVLINPDSQVGVVGASGAICGVYGAYFLSVRASPRAALADPQVRNAMISFLAINVVLMALLPLPIAWEAHLGGFVAGALAYPLLAPRRRGPWG